MNKILKPRSYVVVYEAVDFFHPEVHTATVTGICKADAIAKVQHRLDSAFGNRYLVTKAMEVYNG